MFPTLLPRSQTLLAEMMASRTLPPVAGGANGSSKQHLTEPGVARWLGFGPMTVGYDLPLEQWMLDNVLRDLDRAGVPYTLVRGARGVEVWKK